MSDETQAPVPDPEGGGYLDPQTEPEPTPEPVEEPQPETTEEPAEG